MVLFHDIGAGNVGRHQVGSELNATKLHLKSPRQRAGHQGLTQPRHAVQQDVAATQHPDQQRINDFVLADDDLGQFVLDLVTAAASSFKGGVGIVAIRLVTGDWS
jgi:hypothetical protein